MQTRLPVLLSLTMLMVAGPIAADPPSGDQAIDIKEIISLAGEAMISPPGDKPSLPKFEEVTKDMVSDKGLFTLWYYPATAKDQDAEKLLCQIPAGFLGEKFMLSVSFSGGGLLTGFPLEECVVQWEVLDRQLLLIEPETRFVVDDSKTISDVVRRTYPERIRAAVPIVTKSAGGDPVIDLGPMLKSNFADIAWISALDDEVGMFGFGMSSINSGLSRWIKKKVFPLNVEIGVELALSSQSPPGSYSKKLVHYSFWKLPTSDYAPRVADDRIGYFLTANQDWSKPTDARDIFNRYIDRWNLQKRDPSLKLCEPKKPITFYIEKTVPVRFRRAIRDGILEWNKAFEKCGFVNAVEVRQQTEDNEWKDLDPEDMRYSFFRWIVNGWGFAMGPHRANPFTGQIYDADIIMDDAMVRFFEQEAQQMLLPSDAVALKLSDPVCADFMERFPQWRRPTREWESLTFGDSEDARLRGLMRHRMNERMRERGYCCCEYAEGMKHQMATAHAVLAGQPKEVIERFLYDALKETVMHEVGHTLGLRHNFKASSIWSIEEIKKRRAKGEATCGSVMDYNPALFFADKQLDGPFLTSTLGPWDYWVIEYGYRPADGSYNKDAKDEGGDKAKDDAKEKEAPKPDAKETAVTESAEVRMPDIPADILDKLPPEVKKMIASGAFKEMMASAGADVDVTPPKKPSSPMFAAPACGELKMLQEIASRAAEPELAYATDEDSSFLGADALAARFDMGADPLDWARTRFDLVDKRMKNILDWSVKDEESWYHARQAFIRLMIEKVFVLDYVGKYIGGQHTSRSHRGDNNEQAPFTIVDAKRQREALAFIEKYLFDDGFFSVSADVLNHLTAPRWAHAGARVSYTVDFPIHDMIGLMQWWNLFDRLYPNTLRRIHDNEMKTTGEDKLTVAEYLQRIQTGCWSGATDVHRAKEGTWTDNAPFISSIRRSLQREYLRIIEALLRTRPGQLLSPDLHAMVQHSAGLLKEKIGAILDNDPGLDFASKAHLESCKSRIERVLESELREY
ncbi:MAG: zinc-dependent metalloprotease [Phycisphaerae bacterium]|nr:zinc-dependent metalloprotease [Phycisphaerae bacterium]